MRRLIQGQGGSTLIELLVAMPLAILVLGLVFDGFAAGAAEQKEVEERAATIVRAQEGLERMTRAMRQADWVYFRSSSIVDMETMVRSSPTAEAAPALVRFDCSVAGQCWRHVGAATTYPPPAAPVFQSRDLVVGPDLEDIDDTAAPLANHDVFVPKSIDAATGAVSVDYLEPEIVDIRLRLELAQREKTLEILDGVTLRNVADR